MIEEKHFCDRCKKEILVRYDIVLFWRVSSDKWKSKTLELCSSCHSEFERFIKTKDKNKLEMERKYYRWREASFVLGFFLAMFVFIIAVLVTTGVCK